MENSYEMKKIIFEEWIFNTARKVKGHAIQEGLKEAVWSLTIAEEFTPEDIRDYKVEVKMFVTKRDKNETIAE